MPKAPPLAPGAGPGIRRVRGRPAGEVRPARLLLPGTPVSARRREARARRRECGARPRPRPASRTRAAGRSGRLRSSPGVCSPRRRRSVITAFPAASSPQRRSTFCSHFSARAPPVFHTRTCSRRRSRAARTAASCRSVTGSLVRLLVARRDERVDRERVVLGRRLLLLEERAEDADLDGIEGPGKPGRRGLVG